MDERKGWGFKSGQMALSVEEFRKAANACRKPLDSVILHLACTTGIRRADLVALEWANVDLDEKRLCFWEAKKRRKWTIPLTDQTVAVLRQWRSIRRKDRHVLPIMGRQMYNRFQAILDRAGLPRRPFHCTRATAVKLALRAGWSIEQVAQLTGDKASTIMEHYSIPSRSEMDEVARAKPLF